MLRSGCISLACLLRLLVFSLVGSLVAPRAEIIYDNTSTFLNRFFIEKTEYGDQVDLGGTARRLTQILFEYYGQFAQDGDEVVKVRVYSNETPYDSFRKAPTTQLFESGWMPINPGYNARAISGLNLALPARTVTVTFEFAGIGEDEVAGLLFYGPPTIGHSFNEIWLRGALGQWVPVLYSSSDPTKRASASLRLVAEPDVLLDQQQTNSANHLALLEGTNHFRLAQTFRPEIAGRLRQVGLSMQFTNSPVRVRILDTVGQAPGPNVLGERFLLRGTGAKELIDFWDESIYLKAGTNYAVELSTAANLPAVPSHLVPVSRNAYSRGDLWSRPEAGGTWTSITENNNGFTFLDAFFETHVTPTQPEVELTHPRPKDTFDLAEPIELRATVRPPEIGTIAHVRFLNGAQEIGRATNAPYTFIWTNAGAGEHILRAIAEDSFRRPFRSEVIPIDVHPAGPPENDQFARRKMLNGTRARSVKPTAAATVEAGEPPFATTAPGATLWWSWTAYDNSPVILSAQNSSEQGAHLAVFTGNVLTNLVAVTNGTTRVEFIPKAGVTYAIALDPKARGNQVALDLAAADVRLQRLTPSVPRATEPVLFSLAGSSSSFVTNISLLANGLPIAGAVGPAATLTGYFPTNGTYSVVVAATDSYGIQTISAPLQVTVRPDNDAFRHAQKLTGLGATVPFSTFAATAELIDPIWFGADSYSLWYQWRAPGVGDFTLETDERASDSAFAVYTARTNGALVLLDFVTELDATNQLTFPANAGQLYYVFVAAAEPESSSFSFEYRPFQIGGFSVQNEIVTLRLSTRLNQRIAVETSTNLINWLRAGETIIGTSTEVTWIVPPQPGGVHAEKARFFRLVQE